MLTVYSGMESHRLESLLAKFARIRIGLIGDICLDVYWLADMRKSELSRETPHYPLPIVSERMSPGAGGNVAANMAALRPGKLELISAVGPDWRGSELVRIFTGLGIDTAGIMIDPGMTTNAYIKPLRSGISSVVYEDPRLDFANHAPISETLENAIIERLDRSAASLDVLCVSDQMRFGLISERVRGHICRLAGQGLRVVVDSRDHIRHFAGVILKPNEIEGARAVGIDPTSLNGLDDFADAAQKLSSQNNSEVVMTIGALGALYADRGAVIRIPAPAVEGPIDICGAGDSFLSGFGLALAAGADQAEAAHIGNLCSSITIRQIGTTGTASREQILAV